MEIENKNRSGIEKKLSPENGREHPRALIPELCRQFYRLGWVTGTGGGISIRLNEEIFVAPSGVQKERLQSNELFVIDIDGQIKQSPPSELNLKRSECTPLFLLAYRHRNAGAVIHSHSINAVLASLIDPSAKEFRVSHQEMIKGIKKGSSDENHRYFDTLIVPIIENTAFERDLTEQLEKAISSYPQTNAVLVRRHGVYVWGKTWQQAKTMAECYDYLFDYAVQLRKLHIQPCPSSPE
ncbi:methylthioribulose-1-phosphate dehydratase-like protein [Sarcoptes scabiei]|uniref:Probable methylthioribulose-1-phosphate dehydratase n=1 Tax=Sarcoptes scabiei TaxID=52283 RepID=A0A131ZWL2_SARSC|nr:methylthioribulose-1-phosphate dehydratase-like protein [Sarcoptes scabiei]